MSKAGGSGSFNHGDNAIDFQRSSDATEKSDQTSSRFRQSLSDTDRREHQDRENRVKEIRANKTAPTTAGRIIGGTPEIGHHVGHSKVYLEKNQVSVVEDPRLGEVWQRTSDGKIKIERKDPGTGEESHIEVKGRLSVEKSGDQVTAFKADIQFQNGREVSYRNGEPIEIKHPDGEVWRRDAKDKSVWHVSAHDQNHPGRTAHFDIDNVQVDSQTGDIHWHVIGGEGQGHIRRIDRYGQYDDFAPGQRITFVNEPPRHQQAQDDSSHPGAAQQAPFDKPLNRSEQKHQEANDAYLSIKPKPRSESQNEQRESLTSQNAIAEKPDVKNTQQLIDPETGELHIGKRSYRPEQVYAQILNNVSDAREQTAPRCEKYDGDSVALLGSRCYIKRADGSLDKFDNNKTYLGTAIDAKSGDTFHNKGAFFLEAINAEGDINQVAGRSVRFDNAYRITRDKAENKSESAKTAFNSDENVAENRKSSEKYDKPAEEAPKLPLPPEESNMHSAKLAAHLIREGRVAQGVSEINKHLLEIEYSGASSSQKKLNQEGYLQQAMSEANVRFSSQIRGDFWIFSNQKDHTINLSGTTLGDILAGKPAQDRSKLAAEQNSGTNTKPADSTIKYQAGRPLQAHAETKRELNPGGPHLSADAKYTESFPENYRKIAESTDSLENIEWDKWRFAIQDYLTNSMRPYLTQHLTNQSGSILFNFDVSSNGQILNVQIQGYPGNQGLEAACTKAVANLQSTNLLRFPTRSQLQRQHFDWPLHYGRIPNGTGFQRGQNEIIRQKRLRY